MKTINIIHLIALILTAIGFTAGIIPLVGSVAAMYILPLLVLSIVLSAVDKNKIWIFGVINLVLAAITFMPLIGSITAIAGLVLTIIAIVKLTKL